MPEESITITVPKESIDWIRSQVRSGAGISHLRHEVEFEETMRSEEVIRIVAERYDEAKLNPDSLISSDQVIRNMEERHKQRRELAS